MRLVGKVVAVADARAREIVEAGGRATAWSLDVTDREAIPGVVDAIEATLGPVDVWHNNAGVSTMGRLVDLTHYVASKSAVVGLPQAMAAELAGQGITVNAICPGYVATPMQEAEATWEGVLRGISPDEVRRLYVDDTPLGRLETPQDVARVAVFLASSDSDFITGASIDVNGGAWMG